MKPRRIKKANEDLTLFDILTGIGNEYINQMPNIEELRQFITGTGWSIKYRYNFLARWWKWIFYHDCKYTLIRNPNDPAFRNYTT